MLMTGKRVFIARKSIFETNFIFSDDSLGYEFPFVLRTVEKFGLYCSMCPWHQFCRGCEIPCDTQMFKAPASYLAVDWDPTALHLRYQSSLEKVGFIL